MAEVKRPYTEEELKGESISKKDLVTFLQEKGNLEFQQKHKVKGQLKSIAKTRTKDQLIEAYNELFDTKAFKGEGEDEAAAVQAEAKKEADAAALAAKTEKLQLNDASGTSAEAEVPKYKKNVLKKGDKINFPKRGDTVACFYTGKLVDGKVFDTNVVTGRKAKSSQPLRFKVGRGTVIKGWDEALMTMSAGEKAELTIEPEWAYGRKGLEGKIPSNATLIFEVELVSVGC